MKRFIVALLTTLFVGTGVVMAQTVTTTPVIKSKKTIKDFINITRTPVPHTTPVANK